METKAHVRSRASQRSAAAVKLSRVTREKSTPKSESDKRHEQFCLPCVIWRSHVELPWPPAETFDAAAVAAPTRTALEFEGRRRSFAQLVTEADTIARRLQGCSLPADAVLVVSLSDEATTQRMVDVLMDLNTVPDLRFRLLEPA